MTSRGTLLFDLDGTLADPREGIVTCFRHTLEALGLPVPADDELASFIGPPLRRTLTDLLGHERSHQAAHALAVFRERFAEKGVLENTIYPGVDDGLRRLRAAGFRLFIATSKPRVYAERIEGARANGLSCLGALWGYGSREELSGAGAHGLFERFDDLVEALLK